MKRYLLLIALLFACSMHEQLAEPAQEPLVLEPDADAYLILDEPDDLRATHFVVETDRGLIVLDLRSGSLTFPEGLELDEASLAFWRGIAKAYPGVCHPEVAP